MKRNNLIVLIITLMVIGFAAVSTTFILNGSLNIGANKEDFNVYFSKAYENGVENNDLIVDDTHIEFTVDFSSVDDEYELKYEVTNASKNYDVEVSLDVPEDTEYFSVTNEFNTDTLLARTSREGILTIKLTKAVTEDVEIPLELSINVNAVERTSLGTDEIDSVNFTMLSLNDTEQIVDGQTFTINLTEEENMLTYNVTNSSREYDVNTTVTCTGENLTIENHFNNGRLNGNTLREGKLKVTGCGTLSCTITNDLPISRNTLASEELTVEYNTDEIEPFPEPSAVVTLLDKINTKTATYSDGNIHEMFAFDHDKTEQMPANTDYRYIGDDPYNYIKFNGNELWRIIGLIPDEESIYRLKLVRNDPFEDVQFEHTNKETSSSTSYSSSWEHSEIRTLMSTKVLNDVKDKYVDEVYYYLAGTDTKSGSADDRYEIERGSTIATSTKYPRKKCLKDKVGLIYQSDYQYSYGKGYCDGVYKSISSADSKLQKGWMYVGNEWTLTPYTSTSYGGLFAIPTHGSAYTRASFKENARPVVHLKPDVQLKQGDYDGSIDKPYELAEITE